MRAAILVIALGLTVGSAQAADPAPLAAPANGVVQASKKFQLPPPACDSCQAAAEQETRKQGYFAKCLGKIFHPENRKNGSEQPLGCGNFHTDSEFLFGSCRNFFGTGISAAGYCDRTVVP